jgi:hypothetical protein
VNQKGTEGFLIAALHAIRDAVRKLTINFLMAKGEEAAATFFRVW